MTSFSITTKVLHWLVALHIIGLIGLGWWMIDLSFYSSWYYLAPFLHKAFGITALLLGIALIVQKYVGKRPAKQEGHQPWEQAASKIAHLVLIASMIAIPVSGYIFTTSKGEGIDLFGLITLPALLSVSETVRDWAISVHYYASYGLLGVIFAHAAGALKHHFIDRDRTLRRMTF